MHPQNGCGADIGVADGKIVGIRGRAVDRVNKGRLGPKGMCSWEYNGHPDRLKTPVSSGVLRSGKTGGLAQSDSFFPFASTAHPKAGQARTRQLGRGYGVDREQVERDYREDDPARHRFLRESTTAKNVLCKKSESESKSTTGAMADVKCGFAVEDFGTIALGGISCSRHGRKGWFGNAHYGW